MTMWQSRAVVPLTVKTTELPPLRNITLQKLFISNKQTVLLLKIKEDKKDRKKEKDWEAKLLFQASCLRLLCWWYSIQFKNTFFIPQGLNSAIRWVDKNHQ